MLKPHALDQVREKPMESKRKLMIAEDEPLMRLAINTLVIMLHGRLHRAQRLDNDLLNAAHDDIRLHLTIFPVLSDVVEDERERPLMP